MGVIYCITNLINGKYYIGQTIQHPRKRLEHHFSGSLACPLLGRSIAKYGKRNFVMEIVAQATTLDDLNALETIWITITRSNHRSVGYNISPGGKNSKQAPETIEKRRESMRGHTYSQESLRKMSDAALKSGRRPSRECVTKSANARRGMPRQTPWMIGRTAWNKGKKMPPEIVEANRRARLGSKLSDEHKAKISASMKGRMPAVNLRKVSKLLTPN